MCEYALTCVCMCVCVRARFLTTGMNGCYLLPKEKGTHFTAPISFGLVWLPYDSYQSVYMHIKSSCGSSSTGPFILTTGHKLVHTEGGNRFIDRSISNNRRL